VRARARRSWRGRAAERQPASRCAYYALSRDTLHQGNIYEASAELTPILLALLDEPLAAAMRAVWTIEAFSFVTALLAITQPRSPREARSPALCDLRRRALGAIAELPDGFWSWVNFSEILNSFGVPSEHDPAAGRTALRAFAARAAPFTGRPLDRGEDD
jgi:hypothetical protein